MSNKQQLLQEAAAWRLVARRIAEGQRDLMLFPDSTEAMDRRWQAHRNLSSFDCSADKVLLALFFALEVEDEARNAGRGNRRNEELENLRDCQ